MLFLLFKSVFLLFIFCEDRVSVSLFILYAKNSSGYLETSLLHFLISQKINNPDIYKDSRYLLTGLNLTLTLIPS